MPLTAAYSQPDTEGLEVDRSHCELEINGPGPTKHPEQAPELYINESSYKEAYNPSCRNPKPARICGLQRRIFYLLLAVTAIA